MEILRAELNYLSNVKSRSENKILRNLHVKRRDGRALSKSKTGNIERVVTEEHVSRMGRSATRALLAFCHVMLIRLLFWVAERKRLPFE